MFLVLIIIILDLINKNFIFIIVRIIDLSIFCYTNLKYK